MDDKLIKKLRKETFSTLIRIFYIRSFLCSAMSALTFWLSIHSVYVPRSGVVVFVSHVFERLG